MVAFHLQRPAKDTNRINSSPPTPPQPHHLIMQVVLCTVLAVLATLTVAQENAQTRIANSLVECYQDNLIYERDNRLPMTSNMLIELIRKVEDSNEFTGDIRQLSVQLVHRFRQDGIERAPGVFSSAAIIPFSPSGFQFSKHRILLSRLLQGNAVNFPNATLTTQERVSFPFANAILSLSALHQIEDSLTLTYPSHYSSWVTNVDLIGTSSTVCPSLYDVLIRRPTSAW